MKDIHHQIIAVFALLITLPLVLLVCLLILLFEFKTPFYVQKRLGKHKKEFDLYKIRSMHQDQITKIGTIIRKTGIDELPQLINIIKGNILLVGPRPLAMSDIERLGWTGDYYAYRWQVKPGLTGLAQISPLCHKKISAFWDKYYIAHRSIILDIKILAASFFILFLGKKRVKQYIRSRNES